ncbi:MAG: sugar transferase [Kiritimatiellae bacterium]|jgi:lipopolysaccharide/colanic/teichoic acid biosynthesis glycosyltransferase|nr:sugar transferase [Kiritimatiellia bacterium]NLD90714.1 sugar transferase [Lentisphaerota bacterium]HOU22172.1 sugar transferase [Kiritimatiellia bacterium]HPC18589.1 sugar transferase [Kiritimatiellia bacterium]HQQ60871.1 sugar transferase [Kiritimatiellia bacterium]
MAATLCGNTVKRAIDFLIAALALGLSAPGLVVLAVLVRWKLGAPVLFRQPRPGRHGRPFTLLKFRTMIDTRDAAGHWLPDERRLTAFGRFLRRTSLDELPELWNVLRGDMSLVGPRPLLMEYLPLYSPEQARRHEVRPGITGWAQVNGRNAISWEEKFAMDVWYVDHVSVVLDARILWRTLLQVLKGQGISAAGHATMPKFTGSGRKEKTE